MGYITGDFSVMEGLDATVRAPFSTFPIDTKALGAGAYTRPLFSST
jgi:hypothetical protein